VLNLGIGVLSIYPNGSCQFKSNFTKDASNFDHEHTNKKEHHADDFDKNSRLNEDSLRSLAGSGSNQKKRSLLSERDKQNIAERSI